VKRDGYLERFHISSCEPDYIEWITLWMRLGGRLARRWWNEFRSPVKLSWRKKIRAWRGGFSQASYVMYNLDANDPRLYLSSRHQLWIPVRTNGVYENLINNKLLSTLLLEALGLPHPELLGLVAKGEIEPFGAPIKDGMEWFLEALEERDALVLKPIRGHKGKGFTVVRLRQKGFRINEMEASRTDLEQTIGRMDGYHVISYVEQADYASRINPLTCNTIRLITLWDYTRGQPTPVAVNAAQRIGTRRSFPVDNWRAGTGGVSAEVDLRTGALGPAVGLSDAWDLVRWERHPETDSPIRGVRVPHWEDSLNAILEAARCIPFIPFIAWDIVLTDESFSVLEFTGSPGLYVNQVHRPLLGDPVARRFFEFHEVLSPLDPSTDD
jgi:hypothetical protein